jgi:hypothetical protein
MTSFLNADSHSSPLVFLFGLAAFAGCMGLGLLLLRLVRANLPSPFLQVVAVLLGIQANRIAVQAAAMAHLANPTLLIALWCASFACGVPGLALLRPVAQPRVLPRVPSIAIVIATVACGANLVAAVVPSSKIDELYYHMLVPARIVADHGLEFYRQPIEAAILPHMVFQIFAAPLHALGYPDAPNIVSWLLSLMLVWSGWTLLRQREVTATASYCLVAAIPVGAYPMVFHVTGGSHAFGDLSLASAVIALAMADAVIAASGPAAFALAVSLLAWSAASSKLSLFPVALAVLALGGCLAWRSARPGIARIRTLAALAAPWLILAAPLMLWTFVQSGSPFGPFLAGNFGASLYDAGTFAEFAEEARLGHQPPASEVISGNLAGYSPLIWLGTIGALVSRAVPSNVRLWGTVFLIGQLAIIAWLLPYDARFLGGLQYGLVLCFALYCSQRIANLGGVAALAFALALAPWLAGQIYYGQQFAGMAIGIEDRDAFYRRYVAYYDDYVQLDRLLPRNAVLLAEKFRPPAAYSPRPMVFDPADIAPGREAFLFSSAQPPVTERYGNFIPDGSVYFNAQARLAVYRRPWVAPVTGDLHVTRLVRNPPDVLK